MAKFLSNDRKTILKSAATGVGIISILTCIALLANKHTSILLLVGIGILAVYWFIPTWFNSLSNLKVINLSVENAVEGQLPPKKVALAVAIYLVINIILISFIYEKLGDLLIDSYPAYTSVFTYMVIILDFTTPFLIRHIYCFVLNRPMNTTFVFNGTGAPYIHKYDDSWSRNTATSPRYSNLSYNIYNHRYK